MSGIATGKINPFPQLEAGALPPKPYTTDGTIAAQQRADATAPVLVI
jgi:hypothetical protein